MSDDTGDTAPNAAGSEAVLRRTAQALEMLAGILAAYPKRHPEAWLSESWMKDLKDLEIACEELRRHALGLRRLTDGEAAP